MFVGPFIDRVVHVFGDTVVVVRMINQPTGSTTDLASRLAVDVRQLSSG